MISRATWAIGGYVLWFALCAAVTFAVMVSHATTAGPFPSGDGWAWGGATEAAGGARWYVNYVVRFGLTEVNATVMADPPADELERRWLLPVPTAEQRDKLRRITWWSSIHEPVPSVLMPGGTAASGSVLVDRAYGWPCRVWQGSVTFLATPAPGAGPGVAPARTLAAVTKRGRWLADGLWYTALLGVPLGAGGGLALRFLVHRGIESRRRRLGECPGCGYTLFRLGDVKVCPECGRAL